MSKTWDSIAADNGMDPELRNIVKNEGVEAWTVDPRNTMRLIGLGASTIAGLVPRDVFLSASDEDRKVMIASAMLLGAFATLVDEGYTIKLVREKEDAA